MTKVVVVKALGIGFPVDVEAWAETFGTEPTSSAVREDVLAYFRNTLQGLKVWDEVKPD
jgi:hypothetical protein